MREWINLFESDAEKPGNFLLELNWQDKSSMTAILQRNRGRFIHFTRGVPNRQVDDPSKLVNVGTPPSRVSTVNYASAMKDYNKRANRAAKMNATGNVPKLGFNPTLNVKQTHKDAPGMYFYPVDFLLSSNDRVSDGQQWGTGWKYYYIVDIDQSDPNGINLGSMSWDDITTIAKRNGWVDVWADYLAMPADQRKTILPHYATEMPGSVFWHFIDKQVKAGKTTWLKALRGVSFIRDPGLSIINNMEPDQIVVMKPSLIKVVDQGENKTAAVLDFGQSDKYEAWVLPFTNIMKTIRGELGGEITWKDKRPTLTFSKGWGNFVITTGEVRDSRFGLYINYTYGRATGYKSFSMDDLHKRSKDEIVNDILALATRISRLKTDLSFKPFIDEKQAKEYLKLVGLECDKTEINNGDIKKMHVNGRKDGGISDCPVWSSASIAIGESKFTLSCFVRIGDKHRGGIVSVSSYPDSFTDIDTALQKVGQDFCASAERYFDGVGPKGFVSSWKKWTDPEEFEAFKGWFIVNCGFDFGGIVHEHFRSQIEAYVAYDSKSLLLSDIRYKNSNF